MSNRGGPELDNGFHGGDLADAVLCGVHTSHGMQNQDWLDLSTGINPNAYPVPEFPVEVWRRLPGRIGTDELLAAASGCYGAPDADHVAAAPGSQALIQILPYCLPDLPVAVLGPTYGGHVSGWRAAGREVTPRAALEECDPGGITVLVNPNNPDGRVFPENALADFADRCTRARGWLIVDEAYCDLEPPLSMSSWCGTQNLVVLRSFGKFFGLAGLRLGFAIAPLALISHLRRSLGAWTVSGPAIQIGAQALRDTSWQEAQREALHLSASRLDDLLKQGGLEVRGGTALFRLAQSPRVPAVFTHLLEHGIYVRRFGDHRDWLRFGLPGSGEDWSRLGHAMISFKT